MTSFNLIQVIFLWHLLMMVQMVNCSITNCPRYCKCEVYRQLNRAECSFRRLVSAEVEIPHEMQILDLGFNVITTIESKSFQSYNDLILLNLSHNAIYTLELESFSQLQSIHEIDLSHNRLEYLDDRTFETNRKLHKLNLEGNKFKTIAVKPFLKSSSLKELNLKNCEITFINKSLFSQLPNLEELNLAGNLLNNFLPQDFDGLLKLRVLNLSKNPMRCDKSMQKKLQQLQDKGIKVTMEECKRLQEAPTMVEEKKAMSTQLPQPEDNKASMQWNYDLQSEEDEEEEEDDFDENYEKPMNAHVNLFTKIEWLKFARHAAPCDASKFELCQNYRQCLANLNNARHENQSSCSCSSSDAMQDFFLVLASCLCTAIILHNCNLYKRKRKDCRCNVKLTVDTKPLLVDPQPMDRRYQQLPAQVHRGHSRQLPVFNNRLSCQNSNERLTGSGSKICMATDRRPVTPPPCYGDILVEVNSEISRQGESN